MSFLKDLYDGEIRPCEEIPDTDQSSAVGTIEGSQGS